MYSLIPTIIGILLIILEYKMLCHFVIKSSLSNDSKKGWIIAFVLVGGIASIVYFFTEYRKNRIENINLIDTDKDADND